jgi:phosphoribosylanthranilate isomerase
MVARLPERIEKVGVFVEESAEQIQEVVRQTGLTAAQIYDTNCAMTLGNRQDRGSTLPVKVIFVIPGNKLHDGGIFFSLNFHRAVFALMVDSSSSGQMGGSGRPFDWVATQGTMEWLNDICPTIVAGGLSPANVAEALTMFAPWGVDVSSGVEAAPGKKDPDKVRAFVQAVRAAEKSA